MKPPVHRMRKDEIVWLSGHNCAAHGHDYLSHYNCYLKEQPSTTRIGFLDIECSNLQSDFGIILSYCIKEAGTDRIYQGVIKKRNIDAAKAGDEDRELVKQLVQDMGQFDHLVTYYGSRFDIPYIRARAVSMGLDFPVYGSRKHTDLYFVVRNRFSTLSSKRLENACRVLLGQTDKTRVDSKYWRGGMRGDKASLAYILDHNIKDVVDLEKLYNKVIRYAKRNDVSI